MLFNSLDFFIFFPIVLLLYALLPLRLRLAMLVVASFYFYMYWNARYASIIVFFIVVDYYAGRFIADARTPRRKKLGLLVSLACNLGILVVFKYYGFFVGMLVDVGVLAQAPSLGLLLPLGISFHTFQTMSYTIDVYRGVLQPERSMLRFALFVSFFPQLVAGPIERARDLLPQFRERHPITWDNAVAGGQRILNGFVKKVVLSDNIAPWVNRVYAAPADWSGATNTVATWLFAWQIYLDFSGYSDIAIGLARVMGFRFMENFNAPYISTSLQEFWRRWHISLSTWLRDYLYVSLGGNRRGRLRTYVSLFLTMLLGGLWHGASWNFVIWGALHGSWLAIERLVAGRRGAATPRPLYVRAAFAFLVFNGVCVTWVFFRAETLAKSLAILSQIAHWTAGGNYFSDFGWYRLLALFGLGVVYFGLVRLGERQSKQVAWIASIFGVMLIVLFGAKANEFIYFVF